MKRIRSQRGAAVVEFALLSGLLLVFLVGIFEFGFIWLQANYIGNAAREGARVASKIEGTNVAERQQAAEQAVAVYLKSNFLFRQRVDCNDKQACRPTDANYPLGCSYPLDNECAEITDFVVIPPLIEKEESIIVGVETIKLKTVEVTVTLKTNVIWEPMLWPLLSALLPGVDYPADKFKQLTQSAAYAIGGG